MSNINNTKNVVGMGDLLADADENLDIDDLEKSIISGTSHMKKSSNIDLAKKELNWQPKTNLEDGLNKTIQYFRNLLI